MITDKITQGLLDSLTEQAKASPRLRMNLDLRNSADDQSQRMLNAIEPGSPRDGRGTGQWHEKSTSTLFQLIA